MTKTTIATTILLSTILIAVIFTPLNIQQVSAVPPTKIAGALACGTTVGPGTVILTGNVPCPAGSNGLTLNPGTELNLDGWTISGSSAVGITFGIYMQGNNAVNGPGTVTGFNNGILIGTISCVATADNNDIRGVTLIGDTVSPRTDDPRPAGAATFGNGVSIWGSNNKLSGSTIEHFPEFGVNVFCGNGNIIGSGNTIIFNNGPPACGGVALQDSGNVVRGNTISSNGDFGVISAPFIAGGGNQIKDNTIDNNSFLIPAGDPSVGIFIIAGSGHDIKDNVVTNHNLAGLPLQADLVDRIGAGSNCWKNNSGTQLGDISPQNGSPSATCPGS